VAQLLRSIVLMINYGVHNAKVQMDKERTVMLDRKPTTFIMR